MTEPWYDYPDGHGYITAYEGPGTDTPHYAEDLQTPFHTRLTAPTSGIVKVADYQGWGGEIFVQPDDKSLPEWYMYHPDEVDVHVGQHVNAGQFIGLSGGENPGYPGAEHPAAPEWSSGPHTHVGWFTKFVSTPIGGRPFGPPPDNLIEMAKQGGGGQSSMVPANIYNAVEPIAQQYHIPDPIWETVAYVESGFNQNALGDQGTSYGLFQLHIGGQFPAQYLNNPTALDDPALNAQYAMPAIARAWQSLQPSFDAGSASWWEQFAAQSGHPGGAPGQTVTDNEAAKLEQDYNQFSSSSGMPLSDTSQNCQAPSGINILNAGAWSQYVACQAQNAAAGSAQQAAAGIAGWIGSSIGPFMLRAGVGLAGLACIWLGLNEIAGGLKGESGMELIEDNAEKGKERAAPDRQKKPLHQDAKKRQKAEKKPAPKEQKAKQPEKAPGKSEAKAESEGASERSASGEAAGSEAGASGAEMAAAI